MSDKTITLRNGTKIVSATEHGHKIPHNDNGCATLWVYSDTSGVINIVGGNSYDSAYEVVLDLLPSIGVELVYAAYGLDDEEELDKLLEHEEYPDLDEGFQYQPNAEGTGIVSTDLNGEYLEVLTVGLLRRLKIKLEIRTY